MGDLLTKEGFTYTQDDVKYGGQGNAAIDLLAHPDHVNKNMELATRLTLHFEDGATTKDAVSLLNALSEFWPLGEKLIFVSCGNIPCDAAMLEWPMPENATIEVESASFVAPDAAVLVAALQAAQPSLCLVFDTQAKTALTSNIPFRFIAFDAQRFSPPQLR